MESVGAVAVAAADTAVADAVEAVLALREAALAAVSASVT
jgi:hypothetical protein